jgi:hypothetical protein
MFVSEWTQVLTALASLTAAIGYLVYRFGLLRAMVKVLADPTIKSSEITPLGGIKVERVRPEQPALLPLPPTDPKGTDE